MSLKAITLTQPWASLVMCGAKKIETRSWRTKYQGRVVIHAAKGMPMPALALAMGLSAVSGFREAPMFKAALDRAGLQGDHLPRGVALGVVTLVGCYPIIRGYPEGMVNTAGVFGYHQPAKDTDEYAFGDWGPGRWAWVLNDPRPFVEPFPCRGSLGLWDYHGPIRFAD